MASISYTSTTIRKARISDFCLLLLCAMLWGSAFMMMKVAVNEVTPLTVATARVLIGAIALLSYCLIRGHRFPKDMQTWILLSVVGVVGSGIPFFLITWSEQVINSGMAAILMSAGPMFSLLLAHIFTNDDKFTWFKLIGMMLGFMGVVVVIGVDVFNGLGENLIPQLATMLAALCYVTANVVIRKITGMKPQMLVACSLSIAALIMIPITLLVDQPWNLWQDNSNPSTHAISAIVYMGIMPTAFAFWLRARITMSVGYTFFSMAGYLVPVFGVIFGAIFLGEIVEVQALIALALVLCGIGVAQAGNYKS